MDDIIGFTYDADRHCPDCAVARFGGVVLDDGPEFESLRDSEGNPISVLFENTEIEDSVAFCGTCGEALTEGAIRYRALNDLAELLVLFRPGQIRELPDGRVFIRRPLDVPESFLSPEERSALWGYEQ